VRRLDRAAVAQRDDDAVTGALDRVGARLAQYGHPAATEDVLEHLGRVGVLAGRTRSRLETSTTSAPRPV
jgi:hypothetical protein